MPFSLEPFKTSKLGILDDLVGFLGGTRTRNRLLRRQMLYPVKLRGNMVLTLWIEHRTYPYHGHVLPLYYVSIFLVRTKGLEPLRHKSQKFEFCTSTNSVMSPFWRFRSESNRRSRSCSPTPYHLATEPFFGRDSWGRTSASGSQSPLPYHLATSLFLVGRAGFEPAYSMRADLQSAAVNHFAIYPVLSF